MTGPSLPVNLYHRPDGRVALRYWLRSGEIRERTAPFPAALLTAPPDPDAAIAPRALPTPAALLFAAFRTLPLAPHLPWHLPESPSAPFSPLHREAFAALLRMLRLPPEQRWCVRGEPGWFLQFGLREADGTYTLGAFILPCGKPAVLTFRAGDLIEALPPATPFARLSIHSAADGLPPRCDEPLGWDTRIRLPIADNGAALIRLRPLP